MINKIKAFTIIELLIVISIIGVLAGLFVPTLFKAKQKALVREAEAALSLVGQAERALRMETHTYVDAGTNADINTLLKLNLPTHNPTWNYSVTGASATQFSAKACQTSAPNAERCITQTLDVPLTSGCGC